MSSIQACLNGARLPAAHPALPVSPEEIAADAVAAVRSGASSVHVHAKTSSGRDTLDPQVVARVVIALRSSVDVPIGMTTGAWASSRPEQRAAEVAAWRALPDFASVNWHEDGSPALARLLLGRGVGVEAGVWSVDSARHLLDSGFAADCLRVLVEVTETEREPALRSAAEILDVLAGVPDVVLLHGEEGSTWPLVAEAIRLGLDTRIGLEDVLTMPDGSPASSNAQLVATAVGLASRSVG